MAEPYDITDERWRFWPQTHHDGHSIQWVMESDRRACMSIMELQFMSKWHQERHPDWREEWNADAAEIHANAFCIQSAPFMLKALLAARQGDASLVTEAIERATGKRDWLGNPHGHQVLNGAPQHK